MTTVPFDAAEFLTEEVSVAAFLEAAMDSGDVEHVADAFGIAARSEGTEKLARRIGGKPQALFQQLAVMPDPSLGHFAAVLDALGLRIDLLAEAA